MFDSSAFELLAAGDATMARRVAELFRTDTTELLRHLEEALSSGDDEAVRRVGHTLKSTCRTIGATTASDWGEQIEKGGIPSAQQLRPCLEAHLEEVFELVEQTATALMPS